MASRPDFKFEAEVEYVPGGLGKGLNEGRDLVEVEGSQDMYVLNGPAWYHINDSGVISLYRLQGGKEEGIVGPLRGDYGAGNGDAETLN
jgi:hypothetical protein